MKAVSFSDFKRVKGMSLNTFNRWITEIYKSGFGDGLDVGEMWTDKTIYRLLRMEKLGEERARRIAEKLAEGEEVDCDTCKYRDEKMDGSHCGRCIPSNSKYIRSVKE